MLSLAVLFLLLGVIPDVSAEDLIPTYEYQDPVTGEILTCKQCEPGTHIVAHCSATTSTQCQPCRSGHYTELWNYLPRCLYCNICTQNQEVETECSSVKNRVCRCKEGFYWVDDFCERHTKCDPGYGVLTRGTSQTDTVCEKCAIGYFSSSSSELDLCVKHQQCGNGQLVLHPGSAVEDNVCGSCESLANEGETLRTFLSAFFGANLKRVGQMKKFVTRIMHESDKENCEGDAHLLIAEHLLLDQIRDWLAQAPIKELKNLPKKLRHAHLNSIAEKLSKRFNWIKQNSSNCNLGV